MSLRLRVVVCGGGYVLLQHKYSILTNIFTNTDSQGRRDEWGKGCWRIIPVNLWSDGCLELARSGISPTDFTPERWKQSILNFTFSLSPCSWPNTSALMTNYSNQKKKCDMGCRQPVCAPFLQPTAINNTIRKAHIALDGRHKEKHFLW